MKLLGIILPILFSTYSFAAKEVVILDVRTPIEHQDRHIKDSLLIDFRNPDFTERVAELDKNKSYKLYCRTGNRSGQALEIMKKQGFSDLENLGGIEQAAEKLDQECQPRAC